MNWEEYKEESNRLIESDEYVAVEPEEFEWIVKTIEEQQKQIETLNREKDKWFNAYYKLIMKPF
jgi:hypothetical protein